MTPKEKAKELVDKMFNTENCGIDHFPNKRYCDCSEINMYQAKQCALIAVDEIQEVLMTDELYNPGHLGFNRIDNYWEEVKQEIENL